MPGVRIGVRASWLVATFLLAIALAGRGLAAPDRAALARCLSDSGAVFYGAHWCPYCAKQKAAFGAAADLLPYRECYEAGTRNRRDRCDGVRSYPTWRFADGTLRSGVQSLEELAALSGCPLP